MNAAHLHLILTHLPVFGVVFALLLLLIGLVRTSREMVLTSLWGFLGVGLATVAAYWTGQPASAFLLKSFSAWPVEIADQHAEVALVALVTGSILGTAGLVGALAFRKAARFPGWYAALVLALALLDAGAMAWTANLGARIMHSEIRNEGLGRTEH